MNRFVNRYWNPFVHSTLLRRAAISLAQIAIFYSALMAATWMRFDFAIPPRYYSAFLYAIGIWIVVKTLIFGAFGLLRGWWLYLSTSDLVRLGVGNVAASGLCYATLVLLRHADLPRSVYLLDSIVCFLLSGAVRLAVRLLREWKIENQGTGSEKNTIIYGAGEAGLMLLREIRRNSNLPYRVRGFVDDEPAKMGLRMCGIPVLGGGERIGRLVGRHGIEIVLIAIPSATGAQMTRILELCHQAGVECKTVPGLGETISGRALAGQMREVEVEDLLGRSSVILDEDRIGMNLAGKVILVTGAGGSIGSELCRQIARFGPARIVGLDAGETALFEIDRQMRHLFPDIHFCPEIGNIQNRTRLDEIFSFHQPAVVYHAAAYKHVPLMETHVFEAVENNVFGTYNVANSAIDAGVESFVLISSDKAVNPTNVMGATKRIAELLLLGLDSDVKFVAVRFGNVLGSNGSVIPIFKQQIAQGGPVTVTHPEMRRFFMTIPEACQLVLQAATIAKGGQICVLDMGEPIKIVDLARKLILLSGLTPDKDVRIEFTGMRPGEKMYEELTSYLESTWPSSHEKIRIYSNLNPVQVDPTRWLKSLHEICRSRDSGRLLLALREMVIDFNPSSQLLRRAINGHGRSGAEVPQIVSTVLIQ